MKNLLTYLFLAVCFVAQATYMRIGPFTNSVGGFDTNQVALYQISGPIRADGGWTTKGLPILVSMTNNGVATNFLMPDNWFATNKFLGQGILFGGFPYDSAPTVYAMSDWQISGANVFVTRIITNGNGSVTFSGVTNALGFLPLGLIPVTSTNQFAYTNGNWWDTNGAAQASTNNPAIVRTDNPNFILALTNGISTNDMKVTQSGRWIFIGTNFDIGGSAKAATNGMGNGAFSDTNNFASKVQLAAGTNAALAGSQSILILTNNLILADIASGTNAAVAGSQVTLNLSNALLLATINNASNAAVAAVGSGVFISNLNGRGTNTFLTNAIAITATNANIINLTNSANAVFNGTNIFNTEAIIPNGSHIRFGNGWIMSGSQTSPTNTGIYIGPSNVDYSPLFEAGSVVIGSSNDVAAAVGNPISYGTVVGGLQNQDNVGGDFGTVIGGSNHTNSAIYGTIIGGYHNKVGGAYGFVAGYNATAGATGSGSWVWNDWPNGSFFTTASNQFLVHSINGWGFNTNAPGFNTFNISAAALVLNGIALTNFNNLPGWANIPTNLLSGGLSTNGLATTNAAVLQNGQATNVTEVGFLSLGGGMTYIISTNVLGVTNCAYTNVNGTYYNYETAGDWTNVFDARWTIHLGAPSNYSFRSNGTVFYLNLSTTVFVGTNYSAQLGAATPTPIVYIGGYFNPFGFIKNPSDVLQGTNDPNGIVIAPKGSHYQHFTGNRPDYILVNTNNVSGWY